MSRRYALTPSAQRDVDEIADFLLEEGGLDAALGVLEALEHAFQKLATHPEMGHKREDLTERPVKVWPVYSYYVIYDPASTPLRIIAVLHGARNLVRLLRNE